MKEYILKTNDDGSCITVRDVQLVLLEMLKDIDIICQKHQIPYYLSGGSCLGAVRHKGFIPWDDDMDISMMYDDYLKFLEVLKTELPEKYYFHCFETHKKYNVLIPAMKIMKKGTYIKEVNALLPNRCEGGDGLFIDVFIVDYVNENTGKDFPPRLLNTILMPVIAFFENIHVNPLPLKKWFVHNARSYGRKNKGSKYIGYDLCWTYNSPLKPYKYLYDDVYPVKYVPFEDTMLPIPKNAKNFLDIEISPDHMQFPPIESQKPKHIVDIKLDN